MFAQCQANYQRVEASLQKLTDSIAAYNPSTTAADELVAADEAANDTLAQVVKHQQNHLRLQELRQTADSLDETIKSTIRLLAETRKEIQMISTVDAADPLRDIEVDGLLKYAKFISKTTVPPTFRRPLPAALLPTIKTENAGDAGIANGMATPPHATQDAGNATPGKDGNVGMKAVDEQIKAWLHPEQTLPFEPWPSHTAIQASALAQIQRMVESGQDPASVLDPEERAAAELRKKMDEERERLEQEEAERRRRDMFDERRRNTAVEDVPFNPDEL